MKKELLLSAGIDYDGGVRRFMGNAPLYEKMLDKFLLDESFAAAQENFAGGDWASCLQSVHTLKGLSGNLSINGLFRVSSQIVAALRSDDLEGVRALFPSLTEEYNAVAEAVKGASAVD